MKMFLNLQNPDDVEFTLTITMNLGDWKRFKNQLGNNYPSWKFSEAIRTMINKANESFQNDVEEIKDV